jgi:large subunit ribosomal protein L5
MAKDPAAKPPKGGKPAKEQAAAPEIAAKATASAPNKARLRVHYTTNVVPTLLKEFSYGNVMAVPKVQKISINIGMGEATQNSKLIDSAVTELAQIAGQKPVVTKAKKSIAAFKLREGMSIGCMVTLRGDRMYEFLDRLVSVALPRVRDFKGVSPKSFDGRGNYTLGLKDHLIFPEIDYNKVEKVKGMNITIQTTAKTDAEGLALLRHLGMPFSGGQRVEVR